MDSNPNSIPFDVHLLREGDEPKVVEMLAKVFGDWPRFDLDCSPLEHWKWKYRDLQKGIVVVAEKEGKVIGCHHTGLQNIKIGDNVHLSAQAMDLGTHPDYRRMGVNTSIDNLGKDLIKQGVNPATLSYWVTMSPVVIHVNKKVGNPVFPRPISFLVRIKDIDKQLGNMSTKNSWVIKTGYNALKQMGKLTSLGKKRSEKSIDISTIKKFDDDFDHFWDNIKGEYDFITELSKEYMNWRYADPRSGNYRVTLAKEEDKIVGYLISRINRYKKDYPEGYIVDLLALPGRNEVIEQLVSGSLDYLDENKVNIIYCWIVKGHPYEKIRLSNEFVNSNKTINVSYSASKDFPDLTKFKEAPSKRLHFTYGSSDWI